MKRAAHAQPRTFRELDELINEEVVRPIVRRRAAEPADEEAPSPDQGRAAHEVRIQPGARE